MLIVFDCSFDLGVGIFSSVIAYLYAARTNNTAFKVVVFTVFTLSGAHWPRATEKYKKKYSNTSRYATLRSADLTDALLLIDYYREQL